MKEADSILLNKILHKKNVGREPTDLPSTKREKYEVTSMSIQELENIDLDIYEKNPEDFRASDGRHSKVYATK